MALTIPQDVLMSARMSESELRQEIADMLFQRDKLTLGQASEFADMDRIGVPDHRYYQEIFNSDSEIYGGSNMGNEGGIHSEPVPWHGYPNSLRIKVPPLAGVYFKPA